MDTIRVVELDAEGEPTAIEEVKADEVELPGDAVIVWNPGVPALNSAEFKPYLARWHREHNAKWLTGVEVV